MTQVKFDTSTLIKNSAQAVAHVFLLSVVSSFVLSVVSGIVFWMQNYNQLPFVLPFFNMAANQSAFGVTADNGQMAFFNKLINFYNVAFPYGCRLGAGIGMIAGAFWGLYRTDRQCGPARIAAGLAVGALSGGRIYLMFDSKAEPFLFMTIAGALTVGGYLFLQTRTNQTPEMPLVNDVDPLML